MACTVSAAPTDIYLYFKWVFNA